MTSLGQTHISTTQDGEKLNNLLPLGASWLTIRRFCSRRRPSAIWGEYLWRWPRFYGKISTGSDSYVLTIWRGTPAKYDVENFAFNFGFSWQDLHKKWKPCTNSMPQDGTVKTNLDVFSKHFQCGCGWWWVLKTMASGGNWTFIHATQTTSKEINPFINNICY